MGCKDCWNYARKVLWMLKSTTERPFIVNFALHNSCTFTEFRRERGRDTHLWSLSLYLSQRVRPGWLHYHSHHISFSFQRSLESERIVRKSQSTLQGHPKAFIVMWRKDLCLQGPLTVEDHIIVLELLPLLIPLWVLMEHHTHCLSVRKEGLLRAGRHHNLI